MTTIDLKKCYPQPLRIVIRDNWMWFAGAACLIMLIGIVDEKSVLGAIGDPSPLVLKKTVLLFGVSIVLIFKILHGLMQRKAYGYGLERGRLQIRRGIVLREEALLPLLPSTEIYTKRSIVDLCLGLSNVYVAVILERTRRIGEINGLRASDAEAIKRIILDVIESQNVQGQPMSNRLRAVAPDEWDPLPLSVVN